MNTLSKEEFMELETELDENQKTVLIYLAEVHRKNPQNPWVTIETLGAQIGGLTGKVEADVAVQNLAILELIAYQLRNRRIAAISQKGLTYVEFTKKQTSTPFRKKLFGGLASLIIVGAFVSIFAGEILIFVCTTISSIIAGIIVFIITKSHSSKGD